MKINSPIRVRVKINESLFRLRSSSLNKGSLLLRLVQHRTAHRLVVKYHHQHKQLTTKKMAGCQ